MIDNVQRKLSNVHDILIHHGIKGQKWGERRYQYEDGSLTPEGRKRYLKGGNIHGKITEATHKAYKHKIDQEIERRKEARRQQKLEQQRLENEKTKIELERKQAEENILRLREENAQRLRDNKGSINSMAPFTNATELFENRDKLSDSEFKAAKERLELETRVRQIMYTDIETAMKNERPDWKKTLATKAGQKVLKTSVDVVNDIAKNPEKYDAMLTMGFELLKRPLSNDSEKYAKAKRTYAKIHSVLDAAARNKANQKKKK